LEPSELEDRNKYLEQEKLTIENSQFKKELVGFNSIYNFFKTESSFWRAASQPIQPNSNYRLLNSTVSTHDFCFSRCDQFKNQINGNVGLEQIRSIWNQSRNEINNKCRQADIFFSEMPEARFLVDLFKSNSEQIDGATWYFNANKDRKTDIRPQDMTGFIKAYEFDQQGSNFIVSRSNIERKLLEELRVSYDQKSKERNEEFDSLKKSHIDWQNGHQQSTTTWLDTAKSNEENWKSEKVNQINEIIKNGENNLSKLEETYKQKLQLEAPVHFWDTRIKNYRLSGIIWSILLAVSIIATLIFLYSYVNKIPSIYVLDSVTQKLVFDPKSIRGLVIFVTIISFAAYAIKLIAKMIFSSFHLQRDSEERKQLTLVYLALTKDNIIDSKDREIILQALFSRAETGLLNIDSSPTMPGVNQIIEKLTK
jgi:hypothetical protein